MNTFRYIFTFSLIFILLTATTSCEQVKPLDINNEELQAGSSDLLATIIGDYEFIGNDGSYEAGELIKSKNGHIQFGAFRETSYFRNIYFDISTEFYDYRYLTGEGIPGYLLGDTVKYKVDIDYNRIRPISIEFKTEQRNCLTWNLLPGFSIQTWPSLDFDPLELITVNDTYSIPGETKQGLNTMWVRGAINGTFGTIKFTIIRGIAAMWETPITGPLNWTTTWGGSQSDKTYDVAIGTNSASYVLGVFEGSVDFNPNPRVDVHNSNGGSDTFLTKFNRYGQYIWGRTWGGMGSWDEGHGLSVDQEGNIYVTGHFEDTVDFDPSPGTWLSTSNGGCDIFLSKFDPNGNFIWARTWGGMGIWDEGHGLCIDSESNIYITGQFEDIVDFDPGPGSFYRVSNGAFDAFVSKFNANGDFLWAESWGSLGHDIGLAIDRDSEGYIYTLGTEIPYSNFDMSVHKLDSNGNLIFSLLWEGGTGNIYGRDIALLENPANSVYITGSYEGTLDFDPGSGIVYVSSLGGSDIFLTRLNLNGNYVGVITWGGTGDDEGCSLGIGPAYDPSIYVSGKFQGSVDFNPGPEPDIHTSNGGNDIFISKFGLSGNYVWARTWGGLGIWDEGYGLAVDYDGYPYVVGMFESSVDFDPGENEDFHYSNGETDAFLVKINSY